MWKHLEQRGKTKLVVIFRWAGDGVTEVKTQITWKYSAVPTARERMSATPSWKPGFAPDTQKYKHLFNSHHWYRCHCYSAHNWGKVVMSSRSMIPPCESIGLSIMTLVTSAVEVGLAAVLKVVLDVSHLVVHSDEVLLVHPAYRFVSFHPSMLFVLCCTSLLLQSSL